VFILKEVKVVCFDTLLQVLILKGLECTETVQDRSILLVLVSKDLGAAAGEKAQRRGSGNCARGVLAKRPSWSAEFIDYGSTIVNACQGLLVSDSNGRRELRRWGTSWRRERVCGRGGIRKNCGNLWK